VSLLCTRTFASPVAGLCRRLTSRGQRVLRRNSSATPCCAHPRPAAPSACRSHAEEPAVPCERAAPHLLQQAAAVLPSHRSRAGSLSRPLGRGSQAPARADSAPRLQQPSSCSPEAPANWTAMSVLSGMQQQQPQLARFGPDGLWTLAQSGVGTLLAHREPRLLCQHLQRSGGHS